VKNLSTSRIAAGTFGQPPPDFEDLPQPNKGTASKKQKRSKTQPKSTQQIKDDADKKRGKVRSSRSYVKQSTRINGGETSLSAASKQAESLAVE
jgi:hypothetical protein